MQHAREAVRATHRLMSVTSTALPEAVSVLLFAGLDGEAGEQAQTWLRLAQQRGWPLATAVAASVASLIAQYGGKVSEAAAYGQQSMEAGHGMWVASIAAVFVIPALIDRGAIDEAWAMLAARELAGELPPTWPFNVARHARGCLHAAAGAHQAALTDLLAAGELAVRWGIRNPAMMPWRSDAALSLLALGDRAEASRRTALRGRDALTPSELRVAQLALGGHTNRQIAQALFVTQRTVENHLTSTYGKLEISTRSGLQAALADHRTD